jgi:hypothetical protein
VNLEWVTQDENMAHYHGIRPLPSSPPDHSPDY